MRRSVKLTGVVRRRLANQSGGGIDFVPDSKSVTETNKASTSALPTGLSNVRTPRAEPVKPTMSKATNDPINVSSGFQPNVNTLTRPRFGNGLNSTKQPKKVKISFGT